MAGHNIQSLHQFAVLMTFLACKTPRVLTTPHHNLTHTQAMCLAPHLIDGKIALGGNHHLHSTTRPACCHCCLCLECLRPGKAPGRIYMEDGTKLVGLITSSAQLAICSSTYDARSLWQVRRPAQFSSRTAQGRWALSRPPRSWPFAIAAGHLQCSFSSAGEAPGAIFIEDGTGPVGLITSSAQLAELRARLNPRGCREKALAAALERRADELAAALDGGATPALDLDAVPR